MEVLHQHCAGMDISKRDVKVCLRAPGARNNTFTKVVTLYGAMTNDITRLRDYLLAAHVTLVVMEATGDYWKPFYFGLESELNLMLVNPRHARNLPGRKTDVSDAQWLAELGAHGLVRGSFVPPQPIRQHQAVLGGNQDSGSIRTAHDRSPHRRATGSGDPGIPRPRTTEEQI
jgi:transposase